MNLRAEDHFLSRTQNPSRWFGSNFWTIELNFGRPKRCCDLRVNEYTGLVSDEVLRVFSYKGSRPVTKMVTKPVTKPISVTKPNSVTKPADVTKPNKGGRPSIGDKPMTAAERMRRYRSRLREAQQ
jgi:hypothetical protein